MLSGTDGLKFIFNLPSPFNRSLDGWRVDAATANLSAKLFSSLGIEVKFKASKYL